MEMMFLWELLSYCCNVRPTLDLGQMARSPGGIAKGCMEQGRMSEVHYLRHKGLQPS